MKRALLYLLKYLVGFGIAGLLIWLSFRQLSDQDLTDIKEALLRARFWLLLPVFLILFLSHWFRARRWRQLITPLGYKPSVAQLLCSLFIGYIGNQLVPRAGEIIRCTTVARTSKVPAEKVIGTMVAERAFDVVCLAVITTATFFIEYKYIESYFRDITRTAGEGIAGGRHWWLLLIAALVVIAAIWLIRKGRKLKWVQFLTRVWRGLLEGLSSINKVENKPLFLLNTVLIWVCYILSTWLGCFALAETEHLPVTTAVAMLVSGTFGIIIAPGGLGAYPAAIQKTLELYGLSGTIGLAAGWILWLAQFFFTIIFGLGAYLLINYFKQPLHEKQSVHSI
ncbi:lysylphosphatidylglycerol synthase transmembrane domain-containing protein [Filimonas effusa]|uniref:Flippase-like domain-containing protein n=1 Tax=Filimonas effusa TaxID=2508721 RepID=A0A4V1MAQ4_9BACT|nr:lysylphosphatidylglycerol synthase transmembrane domain-containing protein [Filimonas effusa]RXK86686.1 flippase-like domain-containing protein [Filimonas effusa]